MIGIVLTAIGTFFSEISSSVGKWEVTNKKENIYTFGFLNYFWLLIIFILLVFIKGNFVFNFASIPIFAILLVFEIAQAYSSLHAIAEADRSTLGFLMVGTIPILLLVDKILGYQISIIDLVGVSVIIFGLLVLLINHGLNKRGAGYCLFSTLNAAITISLYKYCITHYNSVEAQQIITSIFLLIFLFIMSVWRFKENPFKKVFKKDFLAQSITNAVGGVAVSIAYIYAPASIITGAKRACSVLWSIASGNKVFHEKKLLVKITSFALITFGLAILII